MKHYENLKGRFILYKKRFVIYTIYPEYKYEQSKYHTQERYDILWHKKKYINKSFIILNLQSYFLQNKNLIPSFLLYYLMCCT